MRFRRRIKVFPGFSLNLSGSGVSGTFGIPGASVNVGRGGTFLNTSIPGTGLYDRKRVGGNARNSGITGSVMSSGSSTPAKEIPVSESAPMDALTSAQFASLRNSVEEAYRDRVELADQMRRMDARIKRAKFLLVLSYIVLIGLVVSWFRKRVEQFREEREEMEKQRDSEKVEITMALNGPVQGLYDELRTSFDELMKSEVCWDVTPVATAGGSKTQRVNRIPVAIRLHEMRIIQTNYPAFHLENKNGADMFIYPGFVVLISREKEFALIDFSCFSVAFIRERRTETRGFPSDAEVVDQEWLYAKKDGTADRRYKHNVQLPVVEYGMIEFTSTTGLKEVYAFSNVKSAERFARALHAFVRSITVTKCASSSLG